MLERIGSVTKEGFADPLLYTCVERVNILIAR